MKEVASISLIIPVYNEETILLSAVENAIARLSEKFEDFEIILVSDGSTDNTGSLMDQLSVQFSQVKVLHNLINLNVGASLQRGLAIATKSFVVHNGIDMPLAAEDIARVIEKALLCDVLVLQRASYAGYTPWRWACSKVNRLLLRMLFRSPFSDLNFTQVYRREILSQIVPIAKSPAFTTPEMIIRARRLGYRVTAIPWEYQARAVGKGAFGNPHDLMWAMYDIFRFWIRGPKSIPAPRNPIALEVVTQGHPLKVGSTAANQKSRFVEQSSVELLGI